MTRKISDLQLLQLSDFVAARLGLHFPEERWCDLRRAVSAAAQESQYRHDLERYIQELLSPTSTENSLEIFANHLTVGETYFFREKRSLEILEERIMPGLIYAYTGSDRPIRVWCAGCSTGEEPYSVAILLNKLLVGLKDRKVEILATDLNTKSLQKASAGTYGEWSFRGTPGWARHNYFATDEDGRYAISPAIKKMVHFAQLNLMDDVYPPLSSYANSFDVIFCRNVLMYFTPEGMRRVIGKLHRHLVNDGWLIVSPTETSHELFSEFATVSFGDATFYRKSDTSLPVTPAVPVFDEDKPVAQPEWRVPATETMRISCDEVQQEAPARQAHSENTSQSAISHAQALKFYEQGRYEDLEEVIAARPSQDTNRALTILLLARAYANQGKLDAALAWCDQAIAADKMAATAHYLRATILQEKGCLPEALLALKRAVYAEPQFVVGHFALGNVALKHGRSKESKKHFENALLLLAQCEPEDIVPESDGLSVGRLREMIGLRSADGRKSKTGQLVGLCM